MKPSTILLLASSLATSIAQTNYTGDTLQSYPIIEYLDLADVPANTISRFWISAAQAQGGLPYLLPIFVARGSEDSLTTGRRLSLSASIHGDELNGIAVVGRVFAALSEAVTSGSFNGTIVGIPTVNPNGNILNQRNFFSSASNGFFTNLNRVFPGTDIAAGGSIATSYASTIWNSVWGNTTNVDIAVDFHTLSTGSNGPLWAYADYRLDGVQRLAELAEPDIIKIDPGEPGSIETTFVRSGVPAITLEIGPAKTWNQTLIRRSEEFVWRLLDDLSMLPENYTAPAETDSIGLENTYRGANFSTVSVSRSGWVELNATVLQDVEAGQVVGTVYSSWGDVLEVLRTEVGGRVLTVRVDPAVEMGVGVVDVVYNATESG